MTVEKAKCAHCGRLNTYEKNVVLFGFKKTIRCLFCGEEFNPSNKEKKGKSDNQKRSRDQEKAAAKKYGGTEQPGSGSSWRAKGDFRDPGSVRGECKFTRAKEFKLKIEELMKLEKEATGIETPLFEVEFQGVSPSKRYVILPSGNFQALVDELRELAEEKK